jgi:S-formylglutathione hydrolase
MSLCAQTSFLVRSTVRSQALAENLLGDSIDRSVIVYLPPSYATAPQRRYPVVFLLHGVGDSNVDWINGQYQGLDVVRALDSLIAAGPVREMIVVMPDVRNKHDGSFYTDSPVTGNWEEFITRELVHHVDSAYRTMPRGAGWGLIGHSMGGYGALKLAMKHPDVFNAVYALSPCCIQWVADFSAQNPSWPRTIAMQSIDRQAEAEFYPKLFISIAAAWSPNRSRPPFLADLPFAIVGSQVLPAEPAYSAWSANLIVPMAGQYRANLARLRAIGFDYGTQDQFPHIPLGARAFARFLSDHGVDHVVEAYDGDHFNRVRERLVSRALPFVSKALEDRRAR